MPATTEAMHQCSRAFISLRLRPHARPLRSTLYAFRPLQTTARRSNSHRTYFQPDSHAYRPTHQYAEPQAGSSTPSKSAWKWVLLGFVAFPILWSATEVFAARGFLPEQLRNQLFPLFQMDKTMDNMAMELENVKFQHMRESDMHQSMQRLFREQLTANASGEAHHKRIIVRDDAIIARRPIYLEDGQRVDVKDACLIRIVDGNGHNQVVILGVDLVAYSPHARQEPANLCGLHRWVYQLVEDLHTEGGTAFNTEGETMYLLYTNNAIAMGPFYASTGPAGGTSYSEILSLDTLKLPPGWPIKQLKSIQECDATDQRAKAKDPGIPDLTAEGLLASDNLPHGPFH